MQNQMEEGDEGALRLEGRGWRRKFTAGVTAQELRRNPNDNEGSNPERE